MNHPHRERRSLELVALLATTIAVSSYFSYFGVLDERPAALLLAVIGTAAIATFVYHSVHRERWHVAVLLAAMTGGVALLPIAASLAPGDPLLHGELHEGEHLAIPAELDGPLRVVLHADMEPASRQPIDYFIDGIAEPFAGHFERRGDGATAAHAHDTDVRHLELEGAGDLHLRSLHGPDHAALEVTVFRERWPMRHELGLALLALVSAAALSLRHGETSTLLPVVLGATLFGLLVVRWLTPVAPLGQEVSAIAVAGLIAVACYAPWRWLLERQRARVRARTRS